jgi:hypothetical protein
VFAFWGPLRSCPIAHIEFLSIKKLGRGKDVDQSNAFSHKEKYFLNNFRNDFNSKIVNLPKAMTTL